MPNPLVQKTIRSRPARAVSPPGAVRFANRCLPCLLFLLLACSGRRTGLLAQPAPPPPLTPAEAQALVQQVLQTEIAATQDSSHPMQYRLRKTSPRLSTTKLIVETRDGDVARLVAINNGSLGPEDEQKEASRLQALLNDPSLQRHREQQELSDADKARKIIHALPGAFFYSFVGIAETPQGPSYRLAFEPNPAFDPQDVEAQALKAMAGELWIDVTQHRVTHLEGKRLHDVDYLGGILGKLEQGGTLEMQQADVGNHQWRTTKMVLIMNARLLWKTWKLDTTLEMSEYAPVASGMTYQQAIRMLESGSSNKSGGK
jgi:hypothetical protein